jgi:hypothetical protein
MLVFVRFWIEEDVYLGSLMEGRRILFRVLAQSISARAFSIS